MTAPTRPDLHTPHDLLDAIGGVPVPSGDVVVQASDVHKWFGRLHVLNQFSHLMQAQCV